MLISLRNHPYRLRIRPAGCTECGSYLLTVAHSMAFAVTPLKQDPEGKADGFLLANLLILHRNLIGA
jgi:hypothetical protein